MLAPISATEIATAHTEVGSHTPTLGADTSYAAVGQLREAIARLDALLSTPEAQQPAQGGPFYLALRLAAVSATASMASVIAGKMRLQ